MLDRYLKPMETDASTGGISTRRFHDLAIIALILVIKSMPPNLKSRDAYRYRPPRASTTQQRDTGGKVRLPTAGIVSDHVDGREM